MKDGGKWKGLQDELLLIHFLTEIQRCSLQSLNAGATVLWSCASKVSDPDAVIAHANLSSPGVAMETACSMGLPVRLHASPFYLLYSSANPVCHCQPLSVTEALEASVS